MNRYLYSIPILTFFVLLLACENETENSPLPINEEFDMLLDPVTGVFTFEAVTKRDDALYHWYINDSLVSVTTSPSITYDFFSEITGKPPFGEEHTVCLDIELARGTRNPDRHCEVVIIASPPEKCPNPGFTTEETRPGTFRFSAPPVEQGIFYWYIDDILAGDAGSPTFEYDFLLDNSGNVPYGPGDYDICLRIQTPDCPEGSELFCDTITVTSTAGTCPVADFTILEPQHLSFVIGATADEIGQYYWFFQGEVAALNQVFRPFEYSNALQVDDPYGTGPGDYEICLQIQTTDCPQGSEVICKTLTVDQIAPCPQSVFTTEDRGSGVFSFTSSFPRDEGLHYWYIDGLLAGDAGNNAFVYNFLSGNTGNIPSGPGEYEICLRIVTPACEQGTRLFCETVIVQ